jgi:hypothetical protein
MGAVNCTSCAASDKARANLQPIARITPRLKMERITIFTLETIHDK